MICVAISDKNLDKCLSVLDRIEMAEIRLDLTGFGLDEIRKVFAHSTTTIATCRPENTGAEVQLLKLKTAIESGANFVDIEIESERKQQQAIIDIARKHGCKVIISYHNFHETPDLAELYKQINDCYDLGADIAKITTLSLSSSDNVRLLSLYSVNKPLVAFGMGDAGKITRIIAPFLGAEFTFASMDDGAATATGQIPYTQMKAILSFLKEELNK